MLNPWSDFSLDIASGVIDGLITSSSSLAAIGGHIDITHLRPIFLQKYTSLTMKVGVEYHRFAVA